MSLSEVADGLNQANWLPDRWIYDKGAGTGYMPVKCVLGNLGIARLHLNPNLIGERMGSQITQMIISSKGK
jgi:hypothetical protein